MADEEPSALSELLRETSLNLRVAGGRVFVQNALPDEDARSSIELKCWQSQGLMESIDSPFRFGADKHKPIRLDADGDEYIDEDGEEETGWSLADIPIILHVSRGDEPWLKEAESKSEEEPPAGQLTYYGPVSGVEGGFSPMVSVWIALGREILACFVTASLRQTKWTSRLGYACSFRGTLWRALGAARR